MTAAAGDGRLAGRRQRHRPSPTAKTVANESAIIDAAIDLFGAGSYDAVSIKEIADRAEVAHGLIYYYFKDKRGLFAAAASRISEEFLEVLSPRPDEFTTEERLRGTLSRHFAFGRAHPERFRLLMSRTHPEAEIVADLAAAREAVLQDSVGCPADPSPLLLAAIQGWAGFLDEVTRLWLKEPSLQVDDVVDLCIHTLVGAVQVSGGHRYEVSEALAILLAPTGASQMSMEADRLTG